jgi:LuxR family glucitol operon transcriptional activator
LSGWHNGGVTASGIDNLYLFRRAQSAANGSERYAYNDILREALATLALTNAEAARILQLRFLDNLTAESVANQLNLALSTFYERQRIAIGQITTILVDMDRTVRWERYHKLERKLARRQNRDLVGVADLLSTLAARVIQDDVGWIMSLEGIGGIGKTTVVGELARQVLQQDISWENVAWITVRQSDFQTFTHDHPPTKGLLTLDALLEQLYFQLVMPAGEGNILDRQGILQALELYLRHHKCLIVIDNLETLIEVEQLVPILRRLARPSKFILTSRQSFYTESDIYHVQLAELTRDDAMNLVRSEAKTNNLRQVTAATDEQLYPIYQTVGGNPLALRLVVGQLHIFSLGQVLDDLMEARSKSAENLYTFIFWRAWDYLDEAARCLLIAMLLTSEQGDTLDELAEICATELNRATLHGALRQLVMINLVESQGDLFERRFTIHNLTRSFLHRQVQIWQEP